MPRVSTKLKGRSSHSFSSKRLPSCHFVLTAIKAVHQLRSVGPLVHAQCHMESKSQGRKKK